MDALHLACPRCAKLNRIPAQRLGDRPTCGDCKAPLFDGHPVELTDANAAAHLERTDVPVIVDFWAAWCGPCKAMAPVLVEAARSLEPRVRVAKLDTDAYPALAQRHQIRALPTIALFRGGREVDRFEGATSLPRLLAWVQGHVA